MHDSASRRGVAFQGHALAIEHAPQGLERARQLVQPVADQQFAKKEQPQSPDDRRMCCIEAAPIPSLMSR